MPLLKPCIQALFVADAPVWDKAWMEELEIEGCTLTAQQVCFLVRVYEPTLFIVLKSLRIFLDF